MAIVLAILGLTGSGKSEAAAYLKKKGFPVVRFGDATEEEMKKRGIPVNEANERKVREQLRKEHGMAVYAKLNAPRIEAALKKSKIAVVDGLYSWEEYLFLKEKYGKALVTLAVWAPPALRYERLAKRPVRPLTLEESKSRDASEIENLNKGGPIAMADFTIDNRDGLGELHKQLDAILEEL